LIIKKGGRDLSRGANKIQLRFKLGGDSEYSVGVYIKI